MTKEAKRTEILLEEILNSVKTVAEGHALLNINISQVREDLTKEIRKETGDIKKAVKANAEAIKANTEGIKDIKETVHEINQNLKEHIRLSVPPAHASV